MCLSESPCKGGGYGLLGWADRPALVPAHITFHLASAPLLPTRGHGGGHKMFAWCIEEELLNSSQPSGPHPGHQSAPSCCPAAALRSWRRLPAAPGWQRRRRSWQGWMPTAGPLPRDLRSAGSPLCLRAH